MDILDQLAGVVEFAPKKRYSWRETQTVLSGLNQAKLHGLVEVWDEGSLYVQAAYRGTGHPVSQKWNVKVYKPSKKDGGVAIVCVDVYVLNDIVNNSCLSLLLETQQSSRRIISIDDAGWGFPLCGVMVGVSDGKEVLTDVVPVEFFRHDTEVSFQTRRYLGHYTKLAGTLLTSFGATPKADQIEICSGFINTQLRDTLRRQGFSVRVVEVTGLLQDKLEELFRQYVQTKIGKDLYYDPKKMEKTSLPTAYADVVRWAQENCPHLLKTGWRSLHK